MIFLGFFSPWMKLTCNSNWSSIWKLSLSFIHSGFFGGRRQAEHWFGTSSASLHSHTLISRKKFGFKCIIFPKSWWPLCHIYQGVIQKVIMMVNQCSTILMYNGIAFDQELEEKLSVLD
ncbi:uncharacterized protein LOC131011077 [Salvia miltiorrhiza]|uniref:uncharacterized protein LOC131011077 n=1 Tax=Salvia miltiorrhiza TaxID=226208 RepID=UPI0025ACC578|nr:uncharacterized protein LOC131011077 [Salvia miltiorrhiza]